MTTEEKKKMLALHRLQQAAESLEEARYLFNGGKVSAPLPIGFIMGCSTLSWPF